MATSVCAGPPISPSEAGAGQAQLAGRVELAVNELAEGNAAREAGLVSCRRVIRAAGSAIRAVHRRQPEQITAHLTDAQAALREAQAAVSPFPRIAYAGFLHDAEREYAEAVMTAALVDGTPVPSHREMRVEAPAWLNGLAEAASELRRHLLDRLREGRVDMAEQLLGAMDDAYELLVAVDYPDAVTGGLRRSADSLRAVLERTRSDVTTTLLQFRLQAALERREGRGC